MTERLHRVGPLPIYEHLTPHILVGYNGFGKPLAFIANPEDIWFLEKQPNASTWMVPIPVGELTTEGK